MAGWEPEVEGDFLVDETETSLSLTFGYLTFTWNCNSYERSHHRGKRLEPSKAEVGQLLGTDVAIPENILLYEMELPMINLLSYDFPGLRVKQKCNLDSLVLCLAPHVPHKQVNPKGICFIYFNLGRYRVASRSVLNVFQCPGHHILNVCHLISRQVLGDPP